MSVTGYSITKSLLIGEIFFFGLKKTFKSMDCEEEKARMICFFQTENAFWDQVNNRRYGHTMKISKNNLKKYLEYFNVFFTTKLKKIEKKNVNFFFGEIKFIEAPDLLNSLKENFQILKRKKIIGWGNSFYLWQLNRLKIKATSIQMQCFLLEYGCDFYSLNNSFDYTGKHVLDIGGFIGDSASYFLKKGAKFCTIYEPVLENISAMQYNLKNYKYKVKIFKEALSNRDAEINLSSKTPLGHFGFGSEKGDYEINCPGVTIETILNRGMPVDIIKLDCEGAELNLVEAADKTLQRITHWIVETHGEYIFDKIIEKFINAGFQLKLHHSLREKFNADILYFQLK